jgi:hypothetical protein
MVSKSLIGLSCWMGTARFETAIASSTIGRLVRNTWRLQPPGAPFVYAFFLLFGFGPRFV